MSWKPLGLAVLCWASGCVVGPVPPTTTAVDQVALGCPNPTTITGGGLPGDPCENAQADCSPVCCDCSDGTGDAYLASECSGGTCMDGPTACSDTIGPGVCP